MCEDVCYRNIKEIIISLNAFIRRSRRLLFVLFFVFYFVSFRILFCFIAVELFMEVTFYLLCDWLKNNQSRVVISTSTVPPHMRASFELTFLFLLWHQRCNTKSWLLPKQATGPSSEAHTSSSHERYRTLHSYKLFWAVCHLFPQRWRTLNIQSRETIGQEDHVICLKIRPRGNSSPASLSHLLDACFL